MFNFPKFRKHFKSSINPLSYLGMAGDTAVAVGLFVFWMIRKSRKEVKEQENIRKSNEENL